MSLSSFLPAPRHQYEVYEDEAPTHPQQQFTQNEPPPYGSRQNFIPRESEDFGDGGAFPEIHVAQYPRGMGRPGARKSAKTLPVKVDPKTGEVKYGSVVERKGKVTHNQFTALVERRGEESGLERPGVDKEMETAQRTKQALEAIVNDTVSGGKPVKIPGQEALGNTDPKYIRYQASESTPGFNKATEQRIIRMVEAPVDPIEPPKFKHKKVPGGPPSPPAPVMHSPPKKLSAQDQQAWKIPPCVSSWKNNKGYTIPLQQRIAADGRNMVEPTINDKFALFSEALYTAERQARDEVELRRKVQAKYKMKQKEEREKELREIAARAREERAGISKALYGKRAEESESESESESSSESEDEAMTEADRQAALQRERLRRERKRERDREMRLKAAGKKTKAMRDADRDISEKVALGMHAPGKASLQGEAAFDQRLFNQEQGLGSGFGDDEEYTVYSKKMWADRGQSVYRPKGSERDAYGTAEEQYDKLMQTKKFRPDRDFEGIDRSGPSASQRGEPVQFEKESFDVSGMAGETREGRKTLGHIGGGGSMNAIAGGSSAHDLSTRAPAGSGPRFESSRDSRRPRSPSDSPPRRRRSRSRDRRSSRRDRSRSRSRSRDREHRRRR